MNAQVLKEGLEGRSFWSTLKLYLFGAGIAGLVAIVVATSYDYSRAVAVLPFVTISIVVLVYIFSYLRLSHLSTAVAIKLFHHVVLAGKNTSQENAKAENAENAAKANLRLKV